MFDQVLFGSDPLQCQRYKTNIMIRQKIPPPRNDNLCFQTDDEGC